MDYTHFFQTALDEIHQEGRYRYFADLERCVGKFPWALHRTETLTQEVVVWCSNDYLGMGHHPYVISRMQEVLEKAGAGAGGTRNIGGTNHYHVLLEKELAAMHHKEAALLFTSGYVANEATISTLAKRLPNCLIFSDELNHASMVHGIRAGKSDKVIFKHNNMKDLERLLQEADPYRPKIIVFESLYSMEGDFAPISDICDLAEKYHALTYIDEVHSIGVYGEHGAGKVEELKEEKRISLLCSNFGKAVGVMGGYITGSQILVDFIRSFAPPFIFTTALPPAVTAGALASIQHFSRISLERNQLWEAVTKLKSLLYRAGFSFLDYGSHIVPLLVGDAKLCKDITDRLLYKHQIYVQPINYPTVPRGTERLRITPTPHHTDFLIEAFVDSLIEVWAHFGLYRKRASA
jgi:5-aminolevulinate synthase